MGRGKGIDSYVGFGGEVTHGTAGTIDQYLRIVSHTLAVQKEAFKTQSLNDDWHDDLYYAASKNEGDLVFELQYTGAELFWHSLFGTYTFGVDTPVAGTHTHGFTFVPSTNAFPKGITAQPDTGIGGSDETKFLGLHVTKATIQFNNGEIPKVTFGTVGGAGWARGASLTPTFQTFNPVLPAHKSLLSLGGVGITILDGSIDIEVPRPDREHYGEAYFKEHLIQGRPVATFNFNCEYASESGEDTDALYEAYLNETELTGLVIQHQGDVITGATKESMTLTGTKVWITGDPPNVDGEGLVNLSVQGEITEGLGLTFINDTGAAVT